jgi:hypothetical protein
MKDLVTILSFIRSIRHILHATFLPPICVAQIYHLRAQSRMQGDTSEQMRLGAFQVLPSEIRAHIWRELASSFHNNPTPWLSVLLANKSLKNDIYEFYGAVDLALIVDRLYSLISIEGLCGNPSFSRPSPDQRHLLFGMPFHALRGISFHIRPPDSRDPGQLIDMVTTVSEILNLLADGGSIGRRQDA